MYDSFVYMKPLFKERLEQFMYIDYAGYGVHNSTTDATGPVRDEYYSRGIRVFLADNHWVGDPAFGIVKSLYIVWQDDQGTRLSGVVSEGDPQGITLP
jgi:hypothetical protein